MLDESLRSPFDGLEWLEDRDTDSCTIRLATLTEICNIVRNNNKSELYSNGVLSTNSKNDYDHRGINNDINRYDEVTMIISSILSSNPYSVLSRFVYRYRSNISRKFSDKIRSLSEHDLDFILKLGLGNKGYSIIGAYCVSNNTFAIDVFNKLDPIVNKISINDCVDLMKDKSMNINDLITVKDKIKMDLNFTMRNYKLINKLSKLHDLKMIVDSIKEVENEERV